VLLALMLVPLAIRIAGRTGFLDRPIGYKAHAVATPYLGGLAVLCAVPEPSSSAGGRNAQSTASPPR